MKKIRHTAMLIFIAYFLFSILGLQFRHLQSQSKTVNKYFDETMVILKFMAIFDLKRRMSLRIRHFVCLLKHVLWAPIASSSLISAYIKLNLYDSDLEDWIKCKIIILLTLYFMYIWIKWSSLLLICMLVELSLLNLLGYIEQIWHHAYTIQPHLHKQGLYDLLLWYGAKIKGIEQWCHDIYFNI